MQMRNLFKGRARRVVLIAFDVLCFLVVSFFYWLVTLIEAGSLPQDGTVFLLNCLLLLFTVFFFRLLFRVYSNIWRYTDTRTYFRLILTDALGGISAFILSLITRVSDFSSIWQFIVIAALNALLTLASRFVYRLLYKKQKTNDLPDGPQINLAIVGAGQLGVFLSNELSSSSTSSYNPVLFVDCDESKIGSKINGIPVFAEDDQLERRLRERGVTEVVLAVNGLDGDKLLELYEVYTRLGCKVKIYDNPIKDADDPKNSGKRTIRDFEIEDLLFRQPLKINNSRTTSYYAGKTVLVTGGGGSIGSELCRQVAKCRPAKLIILDIYENNAYDIEQELLHSHPDLSLTVEIASVRDRERLNSIFALYRPQIVFHAAAHKHVPLMEHSACEAIKNNVLGTQNTADMAEKYGVEKFILISTDKAVNPTNVMGASKRVCEMVLQCRGDSKTCFAAVRFGNVLGSNGSVIPLFKRQIAAGGPVTITDKRIIRYFMTISEASQLVMEAGVMAKNGELFVLDMGRPVRIYDLAVNMIKLSGFVPGVDIRIEEIGLRPGEKLFEELLMKTESLTKTENNMIFIEKDTPLSRKEVEDKLTILSAAVRKMQLDMDPIAVKEAMKEVVPTFHEPEEINMRASQAAEMRACRKNV